MTAAPAERRQAASMDMMYRRQRHIYDLTRKYYLFGRDRLLRGLDLPANGSVLEIGCGTGRNLAMVRRLWPEARLYGIDISQQMLLSAHARRKLDAILAQGDAVSFDADLLLGEVQFDRVVMSYCTSMMPQWRNAIRHACSLLSPTGSLHIVDFGPMEGLPAMVRAPIRVWLSRFHVAPRAELTAAAAEIAAACNLACSSKTGPVGYYQEIRLARIGTTDRQITEMRKAALT